VVGNDPLRWMSWLTTSVRGRSSIGRALPLQGRGCRFDPGRLHWCVWEWNAGLRSRGADLDWHCAGWERIGNGAVFVRSNCCGASCCWSRTLRRAPGEPCLRGSSVSGALDRSGVGMGTERCLQTVLKNSNTTRLNSSSSPRILISHASDTLVA
jgi:hypothetical protein